MSTALRAFAALAFAGAVACDPYGCIYRTRFVSTEPLSVPTAAGTFSGYVNMRDYSDGEPVPVSIIWNLHVTGSNGSITNVTLRDKRDLSAVLATIAVSQSGVAASASPPFDSRTDRDAAFGTLVSGNGVLVVETSASSTPVLIELQVVGREDWHRPNCS